MIDKTNWITAHLPTPKTALASIAIAGSFYLGGVPAGLALLSAYTGYSLITENSSRQAVLREKTIQNNLKRDFFVRLPQELKNHILAEAKLNPLPQEKMILPANLSEQDLKDIQKVAIRACLEDKISEKKLSNLMLFCMVKEAEDKLPGITFTSTRNPEVKGIIDIFCEKFKVPIEILGDLTSSEDECFIVRMAENFNRDEHYHYSALLSRMNYPYRLSSKQFDLILVFPPHTIEKLLAHHHPEMPEKPLAALGTRKVETFSDNTRRILSMTGSVIPTPNIEANEALSLPFYLHDCYHLDIDSAIGQDRVVWNAFGKHLLAYSKKAPDENVREAFQTLGEFCLDKEFAYYKILSKNQAFAVPLVGLFEIAGKRSTDDKEDPFKLIKDVEFAKDIRTMVIQEFETFWKNSSHLKLRPDLTMNNICKELPAVEAWLSQDIIPSEVKQCFKKLAG